VLYLRAAGRTTAEGLFACYGQAFVVALPVIVVAEKRGKMKVAMVAPMSLILIGQLLLGEPQCMLIPP
jgi:hypothetical protein